MRAWPVRCCPQTKLALQKLLRSLKDERARALDAAERRYKAQMRAVDETIQMLAPPVPGAREEAR